MKRILVIGIGSLIMQDDSIGTRVAQAIKPQLQSETITVISGETDFQFCFEEILPEDFLVIIDAKSDHQAPGSIDVMSLNEALKNRASLRTQHDFSLFDAILLHYPDLTGYFIGIEAAQIELGFVLSATLQRQFDSICTEISQMILKFREEINRYA